MALSKYKTIIKDVKNTITKIEALSPTEAKAPTNNGVSKAERMLSTMAFNILVKINKRRCAEAKNEIIEELSDALEIPPYEI